MKSMTVRGIDPILDEKLRQAAREQGKSVNQIALDIMKKQLGLGKEKRFTRIYSDLDHLIGRWTQEEFDCIQGKIESERIIDEELWQ